MLTRICGHTEVWLSSVEWLVKILFTISSLVSVGQTFMAENATPFSFGSLTNI